MFVYQIEMTSTIFSEHSVPSSPIQPGGGSVPAPGDCQRPSGSELRVRVTLTSDSDPCLCLKDFQLLILVII